MLKVARILGWLLLAALIFVTVSPINLRPISHAPVSLERAGAFAVLGFLFAYGYPRHRWRVLVLTVAAAGALELSQMVDPTRHGRVTDFAVKAVGGMFGNLAAAVLAYAPKRIA